MAPKTNTKDKKRNKKSDDVRKSQQDNVGKPQPPNIFLYIQLASIGRLPKTKNSLEIHMEQGDCVIVKCVEQYNTEAIIVQDEFLAKPTYTLIFQQDNLDRINNAVDNPLLIKLYMRKSERQYVVSDAEEWEEEDQNVESMLKTILDEVESNSQEKEEGEDLKLLCVGYLDLIKLYGRHRCVVREELFLYPMPDVPEELRCTVHSEWHLYTLAPIAKELTFTNLAFVSFESIYNLKDEYSLDVPSMLVELSFRSVEPISRNEYHVIPWCKFSGFTEDIIANQNKFLLFETFKNSVSPSYATGLKSTMEVQMHKLFSRLMRSDYMDINFDSIDQHSDYALICNSFHRFILTQSMSDTLFNAFAWRRYVIQVDVWQTVETKYSKGVSKAPSRQKVFEGILDPAIMVFPGVQTIRFAVELKHVGPKRKSKQKRATTDSLSSARRTITEAEAPTFAIIKICLFAPLGETYHELKVFRETFVSQNRLLHCSPQLPESTKMSLSQMQRENYARFEAFIRDAMRFIVDKNLRSVEEKKGTFCCALQNLTNILFKLVGCDFNIRTPTNTSVDFTNLCAVTFNELELRMHSIVEQIEEEGLEELIADRNDKIEVIIDNMNTIKLMNAAGDKRMYAYFYEKEQLRPGPLFEFYDLIAKMERAEYAAAKLFFKSMRNLSPIQDYFAGWIRLYLDYVDTLKDPDPAISANANECLLNSITQYAETHSRQSDGWILLYCLYKRLDYAPGYSYARWCLEDQLVNKQVKVNESPAPYSMWGIALNMSPEFHNDRHKMFFTCFRMFVRLGLYDFGQMIFDELQPHCGEVDRYLIDTQLKILLNKLDEDFEPVEYGSGEYDGEEEEISPQAAFVAQVNGNVEYSRGNWEKAANYYERIMDLSISAVADRDNYLLSKLRLAYISFDMGNYDQTVNAMSHPLQGSALAIVCNYLMGKAYYKLEEINKALQCFANCTTFGTHVPNIWGFLALINLQLGNNLSAINCWKYARVDPTKTITDETIFEELELVDVDSLDLYIDVVTANGSVSSSETSETD